MAEHSDTKLKDDELPGFIDCTEAIGAAAHEMTDYLVKAGIDQAVAYRTVGCILSESSKILIATADKLEAERKPGVLL